LTAWSTKFNCFLVTKEFENLKTAGLVGGTTWIHGYNVPPGPEGEKLRARADEMLHRQMELAGVKDTGMIDPKEYNFIIGVAASSNVLTDLTNRVINDQWQEGRFSAVHEPLYASLRNREFDRLDCHSNGAMVCLAALELGEMQEPDTSGFLGHR